jgi:ring-1,2-phenylacetyl-CoA epoxidase subunit PaaD
MVTPAEAVARVVDPELRVLTLVDLGIVRDVSTTDGRVTVTITPTYAGCPAMELIRTDLARSLAAAGYPGAEVRTQLAPAWTTDWISPAGRAKLAAAGIAPPGPARPVVLGMPARSPLACPRCGAQQTEELSRFGSTPCKALWRCRACGEPFDAVKPL